MISTENMSDGIAVYYDYVKARNRAMKSRFRMVGNKLVQNDNYAIDDQILSKYLFTNNYRELDAGTVYFINDVLSLAGDDKYGIVFSSLAYRIFNLPYTYSMMRLVTGDRILNPDNFLRNFDKIGDALRTAEENLFSRAYIISARYGPKWWFNMRQRLAPVARYKEKWLLPIIEAKDARTAFARIYELPYIRGGGFLAYEIYSDIIYSGIWDWGENAYVNVGPGAEKGINDIFSIGFPEINKDVLKKYLDNIYLYALDFIQIAQDKYLSSEDLFLGRKLSKRNIEHTLCEFHKYVRMKKDLDAKVTRHGERLFKPKTKEIDLTGIINLYDRWRKKFPDEFIE
jgi:hypothetical protein